LEPQHKGDAKAAFAATYVEMMETVTRAVSVVADEYKDDRSDDDDQMDDRANIHRYNRDQDQDRRYNNDQDQHSPDGRDE